MQLEEDRRLYYALGIFPEDARIPQSVVARLWRQLSPELDRFDCDELVIELAQLALIQRNADDKTVTLHDLLREYAHEGLGDELAATHAALLSAYNPNGKSWYQIEHDGYLYYHLAYHLREAGRKEELYALLTDSPDWMEAKFTACTGDTAYMADLDLASGDFPDSSDATEMVTSVRLHTARQVVNARVSGYTDADLQTLVRFGRESETLAHALLRNGSEDKFDGLLTISNALKEEGKPAPSLLDEAQEMVQYIQDDRAQADALRDLAEAMAQAGRCGEAQKLAGAIQREWRRPEALRTVRSYLAQMRRYEEAREVAHSIRYDWVRWEALRDLAAAMPQAGHHEEAREVARSVRHDEHRAEALKALSAAMARAGSLNYALSLLGLRTLDEFLQILAEWATVFEQIKPRLSIAVLSDATAVAGWVRSDWREIHELLSTPERGEKREAAGEARHKRSRRLASDH